LPADASEPKKLGLKTMGRAHLYAMLLAGRKALSEEVAFAMEAEYWRRAKVNLLTRLIGVVAIGGVMWRVSSHAAILWWLAATAIVGSGGYALGRHVMRPSALAPFNAARGRHWLIMLAPALASGLVWGIGGAALLTPETEFEMFLAMALCAVAAIGTISFSTFLVAALAFVFLVLTPSIILLNRSDIVFYRLLSYGGVAYMLIAMGFAFVLNQMSLRSFVLSHKNLSLVNALSTANEKLEAKNRDLEEALVQIQKLATLDDLTGVFNRRHLMQALGSEWQRSKRTDEPFCMLTLDLDHFKQINDKYGHPFGDTVLVATSATIKNAVRACDVFGRLGGEEFACLLPATSLDQALPLADRLRQVVARLSFEHDGARVGVTASFGLAECQPDWSIEQLMQEVDRSLYAAKASGRNRLVATTGQFQYAWPVVD
jgi:diguanylate cyclase (GGDEF)-like protein